MSKTLGQHLDEAIAGLNAIDPRKTMKTVEAPDDVLPVCPHCSSELTEVWKKEAPQRGHERYSLLLCPHCRKILGSLNQHPSSAL